MTNQKFNELALQAWKDAMGDDRTDLGLQPGNVAAQRDAQNCAPKLSAAEAADIAAVKVRGAK
jgi:hypothetical protein